MLLGGKMRKLIVVLFVVVIGCVNKETNQSLEKADTHPSDGAGAGDFRLQAAQVVLNTIAEHPSKNVREGLQAFVLARPFAVLPPPSTPWEKRYVDFVVLLEGPGGEKNFSTIFVASDVGAAPRGQLEQQLLRVTALLEAWQAGRFAPEVFYPMMGSREREPLQLEQQRLALTVSVFVAECIFAREQHNQPTSYCQAYDLDGKRGVGRWLVRMHHPQCSHTQGLIDYVNTIPEGG